MKTTLRMLVTLALAAMLIILGHGTPYSTATAQIGGGYDLTWNTYDSGGVIRSSGGSFLLNGTIGQPDAAGTLRGGLFALEGGFWAGIPPYYDILLPFARR